MVREHGVEKQNCKQMLIEWCFHILLTKNIKNLQTKEEDKEAKVEAKKEKLPEKLQPAFKKDQVTYKPLI